MTFKRLINGSPSVAFTVYETLVLPKQNARQIEATKKAYANLFPFEVLDESTQPVFPKVPMGCSTPKDHSQEDYETVAIQASYDMGPLQGPAPTRILTPSFVHTQSEQGPEGCSASATPQEEAGSSDHPKGDTLPSEPSDSATITAYLQKASDKVDVAKILEEAVREEEDIGTILPLDPRQSAQEVIAGTVTPLVPPRRITLDIDWKLKF